MTGNRGLKWAVVGSIGVNILFAGVFVGLVFRGPFGPPPPPHDLVEHLTHSMSPDDAKIVRDAFKDIPEDHHGGPGGPGPGGPGGGPGGPPGMGHGREHIRDLLTAPTLDKAALAAAMDEEATQRAQFETSMRTAFLQAAEKLSLDGRRQLVRDFDHH